MAAAVSGAFVLRNAVRDFAYVTVVGLLVGFILITCINALRRWLLKQGINDYALHTALQILTPFVVYFVADELLHASGVIAVVIAGLLSNGQTSLQSSVLPELRLVSERTWDIVVYLLNGIIFVLLGMELPMAMGATIRSEQASTIQALLLVGLMYVLLLVVRVAWLYGNLVLTARRTHNPSQPWRWPSVQQALVAGISGVRGAITLIGVLSLPATVASGAGFPSRSLILFVAAGVVILSLVMASVALPLITRERVVVQGRGDSAALAASDQNDDDDDDDAVVAAQLTYPEAQSYTLQSAVRMIESERRTDNQKPALDLLAEYQDRIRRLAYINADAPDDAIPPLLADELNLRRIGLVGEQRALTQLWRDGRILADTYLATRERIQQRVEDIDRSLTHAGRRSPSAWLRHRWRRVKRSMAHLRLGDRRAGHHYNEQLLVEKETAKGGLKHLSAVMRQQPAAAAQYDRQMVYAQVVHYRNRIASAKAAGQQRNTEYDDELRRLRLLGFAAERSAIRRLMDNGYITTRMATKLSADVSYSENAVNLADANDAS
ncbi:cation:proton antiporter [Lacticaseibacillus thailandensis]|uniref:cation:proton antiporter n=1 Tax=Lacticaseibacillus thailandensis TaxID=381741 RepID=UPI000AACC58D|nr:cation:proton antiporter [Lacticaseibacillus thailandensis]